MRKLLVQFLAFGFLLGAHTAWAQSTSPYITAATIYLSVDDWADMVLNGNYIFWNQRITPEKTGVKVWIATEESLCYFKRDNILAIEADDQTRPRSLDQDYVGIAYVMVMKFSDGTQRVISSSDAEGHKSYYAADPTRNNPVGWQRYGFNDISWRRAQGTGTQIPGLAVVNRPEIGGPAKFLSAYSSTFHSQIPGERHLFRRKFSLNISGGPDCQDPTPTPTKVVRGEGPRHEVIPMAPALPPTATDTPKPTATRTSTPTVTQVPTSPPKYLPTPVTPEVPVSRPTKGWKAPTPTPTIRVIGTNASEKNSGQKEEPVRVIEAARVPVIPPSPTPVPKTQVVDVTFEEGSANIYFTFDDGSGNYRAEVKDGAGKFLKVLMDEKVVAQGDKWVGWDGKDAAGAEVPPGIYDVVYSKDGDILKTITVMKSDNQK